VTLLQLAITDSEVDESFLIHKLVYIYRIELEYGDVKWVIKRTSYDFFTLFFNLNRRGELPEIPSLPMFVTQFLNPTPHLPRRRTNEEKRAELQKWLFRLLDILNIYVPYDLYEFLELSAISITRDMGWKGKEGYLENKVEHLHTRICSFRNTRERWEREWVIVRDSYPV
jgi:hypothetical protein